MQGKIIYEKNYPRVVYVNQHKAVDEDRKDNNIFNYGILADTQYIIIPERDMRSGEFIREAIKVSELYQINAQIIRCHEKLSAQLSFEFGADMRYANRLFGMADKISFFKAQSEHDIAVCLDFYTHVVVKNGLAVAP